MKRISEEKFLEEFHATRETIGGRILDILSATALAEYPYLEDDEAFALGTKSIYALESIGTPEAIRKIGELAKSENGILKTTAINRLKNTMKKGNTEEIKSIAQSFLNT